MWPFGKKKERVQPDSQGNTTQNQQQNGQTQTSAGNAARVQSISREEQERQAEEARALNQLNAIPGMVKQLKGAADRPAYDRLMEQFRISSRAAGSAPSAAGAKERAEEALKAASRRIGRAEIQNSLKNIVVQLSGYNKKEDDGSFKNSERTLENLHARIQSDGMESDKGISRLYAKAVSDKEKAKQRIDRDKKHKMADQYRNMETRLRELNQRTDLRADEAQSQLASYESQLRALDQLRRSEYALPSENIDKAKAAVEAEITLLKGKIPGASRQKKLDEYSTLIAGKKGSSLEQLIGKVKNMQEGAGFLPGAAGQTQPQAQNQTQPQTQPQGGSPGNKTVGEVMKEKLRSLPSTVKTSVQEAFSSWKAGLETVYDKLTGALDTGGGASGIGADASDIQDMDSVVRDLLEADTSGAGLTAAVLGGVSTVMKTIKGIVSIIQFFRRKSGQTEAPIIDSQERWKMARSIMHELVDIISGFFGAFGPWSKMIPFFNSIAGLCTDGAAMIVDVMDMITSSVHVEQMRRDRNRIYNRIQEKKVKYSSAGRATDARAEAAYTIDEKWYHLRGTDIDAKRRALMEKVAADDPAIQRVGRADLRSRNDSYARNAQYGLSTRIQNIRGSSAEEKSKKRELEAMEMMEEYREVDKSHKKMVKALMHNLESIGTGAASIVANGLKLSGEICCLSAVGAPVGASLIAAGMATGLAGSSYEQARELGSGTYKKIRTLIGTEDNKATTREDMAISVVERMTEVGNSPVMGTDNKFLDKPALMATDAKAVIRQGRNVEHLHSVLRRGLDAKMSSLVKAPDKSRLKEKIAGAFGQDD